MSFTVKQVQEYLGISQGTVLHLVKTGQLKAINVGRDPGKQRARWRITDQALKEFEEARATTPPPPPSSRKRKRKANADDVTRVYGGW